MSGLTLEEYELLEDSKYRSYVSSVDKVLRNFESTNEWADLISTLGKLNKVLISNNKYPIVPRRIILSKRLAQCLHPALPSGVHLKALEIYDIIFKCMGASRLSQELFIYSAGLFPLFSSAAMNVRSALLTIFESHFVPLGKKLRPGLNGFLACILTGLEEGSDHLERTSLLLNKVSKAVGRLYFFGCLWECIHSNSSIRLCAITYISSCFDKKRSTEDQLYILGTNIDVMVCGLCYGLEDGAVLIQRASLDLTLLLLPMHNTQLLQNDLTTILTSALSVLLRRDMSLNRRFFAWLLGSEVNLQLLSSKHPLMRQLSSILIQKGSIVENDHESLDASSSSSGLIYFEAFSKSILINGFTNILRDAITCVDGTDLRPFKIIGTLLDRDEIGSIVLEAVFLDLVRFIYHANFNLKSDIDESKHVEIKSKFRPNNPNIEKSAQQDKIMMDLNKSVLVIFAAIQPNYPWIRMSKLLEDLCSKFGSKTRDGVDVMLESEYFIKEIGKDPDILEVCRLSIYLIAFLPFDTPQQIQLAEIHGFLFSVTHILDSFMSQLSPWEVASGLQLCKTLLKKLVSSFSSFNAQIRCEVNPEFDSNESTYSSSIPLLPTLSHPINEILAHESSADEGIVQIGIEADELDENLKFTNLIDTGQDVCPDQMNQKMGEKYNNNEDNVVNRICLNEEEKCDFGLRKVRLLTNLKSSLENEEHGSICLTNYPDNIKSMDNILGIYIYKYMIEFEIFYINYIKQRILEENCISIEKFGEVLNRNARVKNSELSTVAFLNMCVCQFRNSFKDKIEIPVASFNSNQNCQNIGENHRILSSCFNLRQLNNDEIIAFEIICSMLIELSSFTSHLFPKSNFTSPKTLPNWLMVLISCIVGGNKISVRFSQIAISTFIEILAFFQLDLSNFQTNELGSSRDNVISAIQHNFLTPPQVDMLMKDTSVLEFISFELWSHLDDCAKEFHIKSAQLLINLHNLSRCMDSNVNELSIVERIIIKNLTCSCIGGKCTLPTHLCSAIQCWVKLWQISKNFTKSVGSSGGLNRCLFLMIERIKGQTSLERSLSNSWLSESLLCGDLYRIIDPILIFLLQPNTRRISIQHIDIEKISGYSSTEVDGRQSALIIDDSDTTEVSLSDYEIVQDSISICNQTSRVTNHFSHHPWIDFEDLTRLNQSQSRGHHSKYTKNYNLATSQTSTISTLKYSSTDIVESILSDILNKVVEIKMVKNSCEVNTELNYETTEEFCDSYISPPSSTTHNSVTGLLNPLHSHMLLYTQIVDSAQCLYSLKLVQNLLYAQPKCFVLSLVSTSVAAIKVTSPLLYLLGKHRKAVFGEEFYGESGADIGQFRSTMYIQVLITVCLYFIRSYYPQNTYLHVKHENIQSNRELQVMSAEVLNTLFTNLIPIVEDSPRGFTPYIKDLLNKCKVQKCVIHCLAATIHTLSEYNSENFGIKDSSKSFSRHIIEHNFGVIKIDNLLIQEQPYLSCLLELTLALIRLEDCLRCGKNIKELPKPFNRKDSSLDCLNYLVGYPIVLQPMFLWALVLSLGQQKLCHYHSLCLSMFTNSLPYTSLALPFSCLQITTILCETIKNLSVHYLDGTLPTIAPLDYSIRIITNLTSILHFCLLDAPNSQPALSTPASSTPSHVSSRILYNLLHVFSPAGEVLEASLDTSSIDPLISARKNLLSHLPLLFSALLSLWEATSCKKCLSKEKDFNDGSSEYASARNNESILGERALVKQHLIELLSPICLHYTSNALAAFSIVWQNLSEKSEQSLLLSSITESQQALVSLITSLRVLPLHSLIEGIRDVVRNAPQIKGGPKNQSIEESLLQLFYFCIRLKWSPSSLTLCWTPFLTLVKEGLVCLSPVALLILLACLNEFVQRANPLKDKKETREQQDIATRLLDACSTIAGSRLETTTWLRRSLTVREDADDQNSEESKYSSCSVLALSILSELLAPLLDVLYTSEEKERVIPLLLNVMAHVIPYLRNHTNQNQAAFHACSKLLASLSEYQYTLKAWRKDVLELLLDSNTFRMDSETLPIWRIIIDNLCTHDKSVFKELLGRIYVPQGVSLNLFSSKASEHENCASLFKRLAFSIFCSEQDQYLRFLPDIQERLTDVTRSTHVIPALVSEVLLCFRVLLLRISPNGTSSLWPIIITEVVQVLMQIEQDLSMDVDRFSSHLKCLSNHDSRWVMSSQNDLHAHNSPQWLSLYLSACKLMDLMLAMPSNRLPMFQMYRWAFVGPILQDEEDSSSRSSPSKSETEEKFVPHITRIEKLMQHKGLKMRPPAPSPCLLSQLPGQLLLTMPAIDTLMDLHPFFYTLSTRSNFISLTSTSKSKDKNLNKSILSNELSVEISSSPNSNNDIFALEAVIEQDFLEPLFSQNK